MRVFLAVRPLAKKGAASSQRRWQCRRLKLPLLGSTAQRKQVTEHRRKTKATAVPSLEVAPPGVEPGLS